MICITGQEREVSSLLDRLKSCGGHLLQEVRLDALEEEIPAQPALPVPPGRLVVTCRRALEGGLCTGSDDERWTRLEKALDWNPGWIDLEADLPEDRLNRLLRKARETGTRVLRSLHLATDEGPGSITRAMARLVRLPGDGIYLSAWVNDVIRLEEFRAVPRTRPIVLTGLGPAGLLSRILAPRFHSEWTWVSAGPPPARSDFLPDLKTAREWGMPVSATAPFYAVLGDRSVMDHPEATVFNHLFRIRDFKGVCLPVVTEHLLPAFMLLCNLGLKGMSVVRPFKSEAMELCSEFSLAAGFARSLNTLYQTGDECWRGENTNIPAIQALLDRLTPGKQPDKAIILGTGCLAVSSAYSLSERGIEVTLLGRNTLLKEGPWITSLPMEAITEVEFDLLINATPMGERQEDASLVPEEVNLEGKVVIDAVLASDQTQLLEQADKWGAPFANGTALWAEQAARKLEFFEGPPATPGQLASLGREIAGLA